MFGGTTATAGARSRRNPFDNPFGKVLQDMFGGGARPAADAQPAP